MSRGQLCDRARHWASLRIDGELSELEGALLDAHVARCADCAAFSTDADAIALALRTAPLEWPEPLMLDIPRRLAGVRTPLRLVQTAAAATLVVAAAVAGTLFGVARHATTTAVSGARPVAMVSSNESGDQLRRLRRPGLLEASLSVPRNRSTTGESA